MTNITHKRQIIRSKLLYDENKHNSPPAKLIVDKQLYDYSFGLQTNT